MKTIEEASKEYSKTRNEEKEIQYILDMEAFKKGVEFAQRWIPIDEMNMTHIESLNILVKFEDGRVMRYLEKKWPLLRVTHYRQIDMS